MKTAIYTFFQYILPHRFLSKIVHKIMRVENKKFKNFVIRKIVKAYNVNLSEAISDNFDDYKHFNEFFTRQLKPDARSIDKANDSLISPVDGAISQCGPIKDGRIFQAKGFDYTVNELLACDNEKAKYYEDGEFATIYLSPKDYHRMHAPMDCQVEKTVHVPGRLFSVANWTAESIPRLFARNERLVCYLQTEIGEIAFVLVGAIFVSSMETVFNGVVTPPYAKKVQEVPLNENTRLQKGDELGRFNMGSTVIMLFPKNSISFEKELKAGQSVQLGEKLATILK
ncbi:MAG: phosphatidylserine decarboxylase [Xanthomonadales bacterium]|nr:phosphatidylserine decarboxylase [Xanthomonadales bacterium]